MEIKKYEAPDNVFIAPGAQVYGNVTLHENVSIWFNAVVRCEETSIEIGKNSNIQDNCVVHVDPWNSAKIGEYVTVGHSAIIHGCTIGDNTLIGMGAIIMNDAVIGNNCIIGAGALITESTVIPDNSLVIGCPGKIAKKIGDEEAKKIRLNAEHYVLTAEKYK